MERPTGTVTFLLTDVESSSALWEQQPEDMAAALALHDAIIRAAVTSCDGTVFSTAGDGFAAAFATAASAAAAAVGIQENLVARGSRLRVRIGLHTGETDERGGDYFGPTLNRAGRLRDVAHGGQIVCSALTGQLLADGVHPFEVVDLGEHRLRDLARSERIFQLGGGSFAPLRTLDAHRHTLPAQPTDFVGRDDDVEAVGALLRSHRLVVLTGVGGVGKTRLALEVGKRLLSESPDGTFFVDLAPVSDPSLVPSTVAHALALADDAGQLEERLVSWLSERSALVVLDNCEHLVDACAELLNSVLAAGGTSRVLATSREAFGIEGEHDWQVPSLPEPSARLLFESRAVSVRAGFVVEESTAPAVEEICRRLDGVPLAIELAAARVAHLTPQQIAERLGDRFKLLTGGRGRVQRQHTLQAALDWSFELLDPSEKVLLRRIAVFNGTFSIEAVESVCAADDLASGDALDLLGSLVTRSLVNAQADGRYRLLETVRFYADQHLVDAGEAELFRDRHLDWCVSFAESSSPASSMLSMARGAQLERDHDNMAAAVEWSLARDRPDLAGRIAVATTPMWGFHAHHEEAARWLRGALDRSESLDPNLVVACLAWLTRASMTMMTNDTVQLARSATKVEGVSATGPMALIWGYLTTMAGSRAAALGDPHDPVFENALTQALAAHTSPDSWRVMALAACASGLVTVGRWAEAVELAEECRSVAGITDDEFLAVPAAHGILIVAWHLLGADDRSFAAAKRGLHRAADANRWAAYEGVALAAHGEIRQARARAVESLEATKERNIPLSSAEVLINLGAIEALAGTFERAGVLLAAGRSLGRGYPGGFRSPLSYALYAHYVPVVREHLAPDVARRARDQGEAMTLEQARHYGETSLAS